ncbi:gem-associated protein 8 [Polyergus mexicanus]|uniref:gem-associated protein 8 n=1 Tax=Polyergus mexicanus TaxID=615972 RepID=UPI0038B4DFE5
MEFVATKRRKKWKKKRYLKRKWLHERIKIEVKSAKRWELLPEYINAFEAQETLGTSTMQADTFWKNYAIAQEWQKRHNITWWRSRCLALEYENEMLRNKMRFLAQHCAYPNTVIIQENDHYKENNDKDVEKENYIGSKSDIEDVEFNVTEDMLKFFETSERHRRQLKQKQNSNEIAYKEEYLVEEIPIIDSAESVRTREQDADLLYGDDSSKILAMETALQAATNKYKDTVNPQYWPNIPLKP